MTNETDVILAKKDMDSSEAICLEIDHFCTLWTTVLDGLFAGQESLETLDLILDEKLTVSSESVNEVVKETIDAIIRFFKWMAEKAIELAHAIVNIFNRYLIMCNNEYNRLSKLDHVSNIHKLTVSIDKTMIRGRFIQLVGGKFVPLINNIPEYRDSRDIAKINKWLDEIQNFLLRNNDSTVTYGELGIRSVGDGMELMRYCITIANKIPVLDKKLKEIAKVASKSASEAEQLKNRSSIENTSSVREEFRHRQTDVRISLSNIKSASFAAKNVVRKSLYITRKIR